MGEPLVIDALLRDPTPAEVAEGLERNPGSARLAQRGWQPLWFELRLDVGDVRDHTHLHSLVWRDPARTPAAVAEDELEYALEEVLRRLRDDEGLDAEAEDVAERRVRVEVSAPAT